QLHATIAELSHDLVRSIRGAVRGHDHFEQLPGIVLLQRIVDLAGDVLLFVVGGDDHRHGGPDRQRDQPTPSNRGEERQKARVTRIGPEDGTDENPEKYLHEILQDQRVIRWNTSIQDPGETVLRPLCGSEGLGVRSRHLYLADPVSLSKRDW